MSRNVDTNSIAEQGTYPEMAVVADTLGPHFRAESVLDASGNGGNKAMCSRALPRFQEFCEWCFARDEEAIVVAAGHSLWFKNFFKTYLPRSSTHVAKTEKMYNCGVVSFDLVMSADGKKWKVAEKSIKEVYLGFKKSSRSKKSSRNMLLVACAVAVAAVLFTFQPPLQLLLQSQIQIQYLMCAAWMIVGLIYFKVGRTRTGISFCAFALLFFLFFIGSE